MSLLFRFTQQQQQQLIAEKAGLEKENAKLRAENAKVTHENLALKGEKIRLLARLHDMHQEHERVCRSLTDDLRRQFSASAVIEDDSITSAEDLSQRMQCAQPVTPADLDNAIQTLLAVKRAHNTLKP